MNMSETRSGANLTVYHIYDATTLTSANAQTVHVFNEVTPAGRDEAAA